jgi:hypothetical protein
MAFQRRAKSKPGRPLTEPWWERWNRLHGTTLDRQQAERMGKQTKEMGAWRSTSKT